LDNLNLRSFLNQITEDINGIGIGKGETIILFMRKYISNNQFYIMESNESKDNKRAYVEGTKELPPGYVAYCIYVPSGFDKEYETKLIEVLKKWGENLGKNVFVATWDIGDPSYVEFSKKINLKSFPALILTDTNDPDTNSFLIKITDIRILSDIEKLKVILPVIIQLIIINEKKEALQNYMRVKNETKIKDLIKEMFKNINIKFKFSISLGIFSISLENK